MRHLFAGYLLAAAASLTSACSSASDTPAPPKLTPAAATDSILDPALGADLGLWVWHKEEIIESAASARLLDFCQRRGVRRLLVQVVFETDAKGGPRLAHAAAFGDFLARAGAAGIAVEALDGDAEMGYANKRADTLAKLDAVLAFQAAQPAGARFVGVHYDIEPYASARWKAGDTASAIREILETKVAIRAAVRAADPGLTVSYDLPFWYDSNPAAADIEFDGARKNFHQHIQDLSDYIGIMSYRRAPTGPNSITELCKEELAYARLIGKRVYPSIETMPLDEDAHISFHGRPAAEFLSAARETAAALAGAPEFGGVFIHYYRPLRDLLEPAAAQP